MKNLVYTAWKNTIIQETIGVVLIFTAYGALLSLAWFLEDIRRSIYP